MDIRLLSAYRRIEEAWEEVAEILLKNSIPGPIEIETAPGEKLSWIRIKGKYRICAIFGEQIKPLSECNANIKMRMLSFAPELFKEAERVVNNFVALADLAISQYKKGREG